MKAAKLANKSIVIRIGEMITYANRRAEIVKLTGRRVLLNSVDSHTIDDVELFEFLKSLRLPEDLPDDDDDYEQPFAEHTSLLPWQLDELTRRVEVLHWLVYQEEQGARLNDVIGEACDKLGRRERSVRYWLARFKQGHDPVDKRWRGQVSARIDRRWISIAREHIVALYGQPRKTRDLFIEEVNDEYLETYGDDPTHQLPSASSAYRWIARLGFKKSVFDGSTETMRSKVDRDQGPGGKLIACYPGEYVMLDTHTLDLWGLDPVTRRPITLQITTAIDLFSREICALRVTAESTKAVDMSAVLFEMIYGQEAPEGTPAEAQFNYRGIPKNIVFTEDSQMWGMPCIVPTTLITDHGKALLNAQTLAVCRAFGIRIQPAQAYKPTDKAVMERFYRTLEHDIIQRLPGYKGNKVDHKGRKSELDAHYFPHEVDELIRLYICGQYHTDYHGGLINPDNPKSRLSPNGMYETGSS